MVTLAPLRWRRRRQASRSRSWCMRSLRPRPRPSSQYGDMPSPSAVAMVFAAARALAFSGDVSPLPTAPRAAVRRGAGAASPPSDSGRPDPGAAPPAAPLPPSVQHALAEPELPEGAAAAQPSPPAAAEHPKAGRKRPAARQQGTGGALRLLARTADGIKVLERTSEGSPKRRPRAKRGEGAAKNRGAAARDVAHPGVVADAAVAEVNGNVAGTLIPAASRDFQPAAVPAQHQRAATDHFDPAKAGPPAAALHHERAAIAPAPAAPLPPPARLVLPAPPSHAPPPASAQSTTPPQQQRSLPLSLSESSQLPVEQRAAIEAMLKCAWQTYVRPQQPASDIGHVFLSRAVQGSGLASASPTAAAQQPGLRDESGAEQSGSEGLEAPRTAAQNGAGEATWPAWQSDSRAEPDGQQHWHRTKLPPDVPAGQPGAAEPVSFRLLGQTVSSVRQPCEHTPKQAGEGTVPVAPLLSTRLAQSEPRPWLTSAVRGDAEAYTGMLGQSNGGLVEEPLWKAYCSRGAEELKSEPLGHTIELPGWFRDYQNHRQQEQRQAQGGLPPVGGRSPPSQPLGSWPGKARMKTGASMRLPHSLPADVSVSDMEVCQVSGDGSPLKGPPSAPSRLFFDAPLTSNSSEPQHATHSPPTGGLMEQLAALRARWTDVQALGDHLAQESAARDSSIDLLSQVHPAVKRTDEMLQGSWVPPAFWATATARVGVAQGGGGRREGGGGAGSGGEGYSVWAEREAGDGGGEGRGGPLPPSWLWGGEAGGSEAGEGGGRWRRRSSAS
eukprot:SM000278S10007  [mRNA]  locus=s278:80175:84983:+ [translate_table: standard]